MTNEQAKSELMQLYGSLSEEKKQALDVLMAQADGEYISRQAVQNYIAHFLSLYLQDNVREAVEAIDEVIGDMPSVDIPQDHDGCKDCRYQYKGEDELPCRECQQNYKDKWESRPHWKKISPADIYECSECGQNVMTQDIDAYNFCHGCGCSMEIER